MNCELKYELYLDKHFLYGILIYLMYEIEIFLK